MDRVKQVFLAGGMALAVVLAVALPMGVFAETGDDQTPEFTRDGRYQLERRGENFVRLDTLTGEMSICTIEAEELVCRLSADERDAFLDELTDLQSRMDEMEKRRDIARNDRGDHFDDGDDHDYGSDRFEKELDQALDFSKRALRKFRDVIEDLENDRPKGGDL